jgi:hypothetical protein
MLQGRGLHFIVPVGQENPQRQEYFHMADDKFHRGNLHLSVVPHYLFRLMKKSNVSNIEIEETFSSQLSDKRINEISKRNREKNKNKKK